MSSYIKQRLYELCLLNIEEKIASFEQSLHDIAASKKNETKSSTGDKYETARAMLQMDEEKNKKQLAEALQTGNLLMQIDLNKIHRQIEYGKATW